MASKRDLKKHINGLTFELVSECFSYKYFHPKKKQSKTDTAVENIIHRRNDLVHKINNPVDPKDYKKNKTYFQEIAKDFKGMVSILDNLD
jgi:hypothetical protein